MSQQHINSSSLAQPKQGTQVSAKLFSAKFRGKRECWNFLATDVGAWLPPYDNITIYHMKDLVSGQKKYIEADKVKHIHIPQYETLTINKIMELAKQFPQVMEKLPDKEDEIKKFPKSYLCDLIYTVVDTPFKEWVKLQITQRNDKVSQDNNLMINMDPQIAEAFQKSNAVSLQHGISSNLLKANAKRRRTKQEIQQAKEEENLRNMKTNDKAAEIMLLKQQLAEAQQQSQQNQVAADIIGGMVQNGQGQFDDGGGFSVIGQTQQ